MSHAGNDELKEKALEEKENTMIKITKEMILESDDASDWLKNALRTLLKRDPVDALNDVEVLKIVTEKELLPKIAYRSTQK